MNIYIRTISFTLFIFLLIFSSNHGGVQKKDNQNYNLHKFCLNCSGGYLKNSRCLSENSLSYSDEGEPLKYGANDNNYDSNLLKTEEQKQEMHEHMKMLIKMYVNSSHDPVKEQKLFQQVKKYFKHHEYKDFMSTFFKVIKIHNDITHLKKQMRSTEKKYRVITCVAAFLSTISLVFTVVILSSLNLKNENMIITTLLGLLGFIISLPLISYILSPYLNNSLDKGYRIADLYSEKILRQILHFD
ncbi:Plasmodium exported protein (hyp8), unknown function [Plasmodium sp. DRC-Itaito]|uniref:CX3CL1-binding protein 1 n=1 Tax=Plasmodium gaboni TaxID=647221 RepID=A0ABY1UV50_9APIC|nr:Plasmodium exported protein (hyp8), unknown function [Plasmodium gaboni]SOV20573.1 Plasmodium exported protein (hyp8), unknown function [Plasmodium sp. DRC-Itaito]